MATDDGESVRRLFDAKAPGWRSKYDEGGPLVRRLGQFREALVAACPPPARVLDFGCGTGEIAVHLAESGYEMTGCDSSPGMIEKARERTPAVAWVALDTAWQTLPFPDCGFEAVVASSVLEYVADAATVFGEIARVLRPRGVFLLTVPDTRHSVRRVEKLLRMVLARDVATKLVSRVPRLASYAQYLALSKNRLTHEGWGRLATAAGLAANITPLETRSPLRLLSFSKK